MARLGVSGAAWLTLLLAWCCAVAKAQNDRLTPGALNQTLYLVLREGPGGFGSPLDCSQNGGISQFRLGGGNELGRPRLSVLNNRVAVDRDSADLDDLLVGGITDQGHAEDHLLRVIALDAGNEAASAAPYWIYEIIASPQILMSHNGFGIENRYFALGGVFWSQITRFAWVDPSQPAIRDLALRRAREPADMHPNPTGHQWEWVDNPNVNRAWESYGTTGVASDVFLRRPDRPEPAQHLLNRLTSSERIPDQQQRRELHELMLSDTDAGPGRTLPLLRIAQPRLLRQVAFQSIDWSAVQIPDDFRSALASGLPDDEQCEAAILGLRNGFGLKTLSKRGVTSTNRCDKLNAMVIDKANKLPTRRTKEEKQYDATSCVLSSIEVKVRLVDEDWAGSDNKVYVEMGSNPRYPNWQPRYRIMDDPNKGAEGRIVVNPQDAFNKPDVTIRDIQYVKVVDGGDDKLKVRDITLDATCATSRKHTSYKVSLNTWSTSHNVDVAPHSWQQPAVSICDLDTLTASVQLFNEDWAGSDDNFYLEVGYPTGRQSYLLKTSPDRGNHMSFNINVGAAAGQRAVTTNDIVYVGLYGRKTNGDASEDKLKVQDLLLTAKCAASQQSARLHPTVNKGDWFTTWGTDIKPADWIQPCDLAKLKVGVKFADESWAGTDHQVFLIATRHGKQGDQLIADSPSRDDHKWADVNIKHVFGTDTVSYDDIGSLGLVGRDNGNPSDNEMKITDFELKGECAGSGAELRVKKTSDDWFTEWTAGVAPQDWTKVQD